MRMPASPAARPRVALSATVIGVTALILAGCSDARGKVVVTI